LKWASLTEDFKELLNAFSLELEPQYRNLAKNILMKFKEKKKS